jgi:hypothetical protein
MNMRKEWHEMFFLNPFLGQRLLSPLEYHLYLKAIQQDEQILILFCD